MTWMSYYQLSIWSQFYIRLSFYNVIVYITILRSQGLARPCKQIKYEFIISISVDVGNFCVRKCLLNIYGRNLQCQHFIPVRGRAVTLSNSNFKTSRVFCHTRKQRCSNTLNSYEEIHVRYIWARQCDSRSSSDLPKMSKNAIIVHVPTCSL